MIFRKLAYLLILVLCLCFSSALGAAPQEHQHPQPPSKEEFLKIVRARWQAINGVPTSQSKTELTVGQKGFMPIHDLIRGQDEISIDNIYAKLMDRIADGDVAWDAKSNEWRVAHDRGQSAVPLKDPIEVVKGPPGLVIIDGHHDLYLSLFLGAKTIAVEVKNDFTELTPIEFWKMLIQREMVYLNESPESLTSLAPKMEEIRDNPNRYLASLLAIKVSAQLENGVVTIKTIKGPDSGVWVKVNNSTPFIEFYIAKILTRAGITYDSRWGKMIPSEVVEKCRQAILESKDSIPKLKDIPILETRDLALKVRKDSAFTGELLRPALFSHSFVVCANVF